MDIKERWRTIRKVANRCLEQTSYCAIATVNEDGSPRVSPIGSLILGEAGKGFYFDKFTKGMTQNLDRDPRICVLAVSVGFWPMLKALFRGRFGEPPGLRLMGRVGAKRKATAAELEQFRKKVKAFRGLKGYDLLWSDMRYVRDVTFDAFEPINLGAMGKGLWT